MRGGSRRTIRTAEPNLDVHLSIHAVERFVTINLNRLAISRRDKIELCVTLMRETSERSSVEGKSDVVVKRASDRVDRFASSRHPALGRFSPGERRSIVPTARRRRYDATRELANIAKDLVETLARIPIERAGGRRR